MRNLAVASCLWVACATTPGAGPAAVAGGATAAPLPRGEVALFVRDATGRSLLAAGVCKKLVAAGVRCRALTPASTEVTPWSVDAAAARAGGSAFAMRVTVIQRREDVEELARAEGVLVPASGVVGRQERVAAGDARVRDDLRLEVRASLRRAGDGVALEHWGESEGMLDSDEGRSVDARWSLLYDAVAERLAERAVAVLTRGK